MSLIDNIKEQLDKAKETGESNLSVPIKLETEINYFAEEKAGFYTGVKTDEKALFYAGNGSMSIEDKSIASEITFSIGHETYFYRNCRDLSSDLTHMLLNVNVHLLMQMQPGLVVSLSNINPFSNLKQIASDNPEELLQTVYKAVGNHSVFCAHRNGVPQIIRGTMWSESPDSGMIVIDNARLMTYDASEVDIIKCGF